MASSASLSDHPAAGSQLYFAMIAGLEDISSGEIEIGGRLVNGMEPGDRGVAMVFQNYALYPHKTVFENMAFALRNERRGSDEIERRVRDVANMLQLTSLLDRKPKALSGGQRQRVAIGRAIVRDPLVFLFDEPLSNLDAALRGQTRAELAALHKRLGATIIFVTHDQTEAMTLGDRIVVLRNGRVEQIGTPLDLYNYPLNTFVATFIGSPPMNLLPVEVSRRGADEVLMRLPGGGQIISKFPQEVKSTNNNRHTPRASCSGQIRSPKCDFRCRGVGRTARRFDARVSAYRGRFTSAATFRATEIPWRRPDFGGSVRSIPSVQH